MKVFIKAMIFTIIIVISVNYAIPTIKKIIIKTDNTVEQTYDILNKLNSGYK